jgi:hypothetical protein
MDGQAGASFPFEPVRMKVIACATVIEEMLPLMPDEMPRQVLDFGLHLRPGGLTAALQEAIDAFPKYRRRKADWNVRQMLRTYTRLAFIDSGVRDIERYRERAVATAERFGLRFQEIKGSLSLVRELLFGPWDRGCVVVPKGGVIRFEDFVPGVGVLGQPGGPASEFQSDRLAPAAPATAADSWATDGA